MLPVSSDAVDLVATLVPNTKKVLNEETTVQRDEVIFPRSLYKCMCYLTNA